MFAYLEIICPAFDLKLIRQFQLVKVTSILISLIFNVPVLRVISLILQNLVAT
jgi:hypothetical protein